MKRETYKNIYIRYSNNLNQCHREDDKPSFIWFDAFIYFCKNNKYHRKGKPARIYPDGTLLYYENNKFVKHIKT